MTQRLYLSDAYARDAWANVVDVDEVDRRILLDRTVFYPGGGGQPPDVGELHIGDDRLPVIRITQDGRGVWHWLDRGPPPVPTRVACGTRSSGRCHRWGPRCAPRSTGTAATG